MDAAEDFASLLHAVTDDPALAVGADRGQGVDSALEAIEGVVLASDNHLKGFVIFIFTNFAYSHTKSLSRAAAFAAVSAFISPPKNYDFSSQSASPMPATARCSRDR